MTTLTLPTKALTQTLTLANKLDSSFLPPKIELTGGRLVVTAHHDGHFYSASVIPAIAVDAELYLSLRLHLKDLLASVRTHKEPTINLEIANSTIKAHSLITRTFTTLSEEPSDMPCGQERWQELDKSGSYGLQESPCKPFKESFGWVAKAAGNKDVRYYLNTILFEAEDAKLKLVTTDGHRLHLSPVEGKLDVTCELSQSLLRRDAFPIVSDILSLSDKFDLAVIPGKCFRFHVSNSDLSVTLVSNAEDGKFPAYERVIPKGYNTYVTLEVKDSLKLLKEAKKAIGKCAFPGLALDYSQLSTLTLNLELKAHVKTKEGIVVFPAGEMSLPSGVYVEKRADKAPSPIGLNLNYLIDALSVKEKFGTLHFTDPNTSVLFEAGERVGVIMPMRL